MLGPVSWRSQGAALLTMECIFESFGSYPVLTGELTKVAVCAIQSRRVQTNAKHLTAYEQETFRHPRAFVP